MEQAENSNAKKTIGNLMLLLLPQPVLQVVGQVTTVTSIDDTVPTNGKVEGVEVKQPCSTARRLEMARTLAERATCPTSRRLADNAIGAWWPGLTADRFRVKGEGRP